MMNRHGLVAGATGTGKTKTLQLMAEQLSLAGVPVVLADMKGERTPATTGSRRVSRCSSCRWARAVPRPVRATISGFGPILLSKVFGLDDTQESTLGLIFHWADHLTSDAGKEDLEGIGGVSAQTAGVILRALSNVEAQGGRPTARACSAWWSWVP
jgi:hypothetical protein